MAVKLWTVHFMRIGVANLLLFISLYVLFPVLSVEMADRLGVPAAQTGVIFLFFTLGMFLIGPFHAFAPLTSSLSVILSSVRLLSSCFNVLLCTR